MITQSNYRRRQANPDALRRSRRTLRLPTPGWFLDRLRRNNVAYEDDGEQVLLLGLAQVRVRTLYDGPLTELADEEVLQFTFLCWPRDFYSCSIESM